MERPAYNNFPKNRNGPRYGGRNREYRDASIRKLRGERYCNPSNKWLAKFIQEQLFTFDYEVAGVGIATLIFRYFSSLFFFDPPNRFVQIPRRYRRKRRSEDLLPELE